jgi:hypothetical protein
MKQTALLVEQGLRKLKYVTTSLVATPLDFGLRTSRTRLFVVGMDPQQVELLCPPSEWPIIIGDIAKRISRQSKHKFELRKDSEYLKQQISIAKNSKKDELKYKEAHLTHGV